MTKESQVGFENKSIRNSRLFKIGFVVSALGVVIKGAEALAPLGVVIMAGAWGWNRATASSAKAA